MKSLNQEKEEQYESEVHRNLYRLKLKILIEEGDVYLITDENKELLVTPFDPKSFWYETWLALYEKYSDFPQFIKTPGGRTK